MNIGRVSWGIFFVFLFFYRSAFSVLAHVVIARLTSIGDSSSYQSGKVHTAYQSTLENFGDRLIYGGTDGTQIATIITVKIGGVFHKLLFGNPILINIGFQSIAFFGLMYLFLSLESTARRRMALLVMLPSFSMWTSVASKEAIVVFAVGIILGYFVRMFYQARRSIFLLFLAALIIFIYKPHYAPAFIFMYGAVAIGRHVQQKAFIALLGGVLSLILLYLIRDKVDELSFGVQQAFINVEVVARSTREAFFINPYDVFWNAPIGMFQAFVGPTVAEVVTSPLHLVSLIESIFIISILLFYLMQRLPEIPVFNIIVSGFTIFWIVFPNYPFGVMNPGSAIRYRSGWLVVVMVACAFLISRQLYFDWLQANRRKPQQTARMAGA